MKAGGYETPQISHYDSDSDKTSLLRVISVRSLSLILLMYMAEL